jgi:RNA polymerase sigma factor (sigma-70 family)
VRAASIPARLPARRLGSKRVLGLAGDERLVDQIRRGNEAAFEVAFERHGPAILGFCRHMLGSPEEAEDAVQHTFAAAHRDLLRDGEREIVLKPWLFAIARNRCLSMLRARREEPVEDQEVPTAGLAEQVERRADLRRLLADVRELPDEQRAALLLAELGDLSHAEVADVLGCEVPRVKALVHRARTALIARRDARETPCEEIREQLANLRGGSLRRNEIRLHLRECPGCRVYREAVREQRRMLAVALPVVPTLGLKSSVLAAVGLGGGSVGGGAAAGVAGGLGAAIGNATLAKVAVVGVLAGGGAVAGNAVVDSQREAVGTEPEAAAVSSPADDRSASNPAPTGSGPAPPAGSGDEQGGERGADAPSGAEKDRAGRGGGRGREAREGNGGDASGDAQRGQGEAKGHAKPPKPLKPPKPPKPARPAPPAQPVEPAKPKQAPPRADRPPKVKAKAKVQLPPAPTVVEPEARAPAPKEKPPDQ